MSYARDKRKKLIKNLKKTEGKKWRGIYLARARQIRIARIAEKEGL